MTQPQPLREEDQDVRPGVSSEQFVDPVDDWDLDSSSDGSTGSVAAWGDDFDLFDPGFHGHVDQRVPVDLVDREEDLELPPDSASELAASAHRHLPNARKGARKKEELISFSEEDFEEGPQRHAFIIIKSFKKKLFGTDADGRARWEAIEWFFTLQDNGRDPTFDLCCRALSARVGVLRLRIHYEFYLRWWISPVAFPFMTVPVPDLIDGEVAFVAGEEGRDLATMAWNRPGIGTDDLLSVCGDTPDTRRALSRLDDKLLLCEQDGHWYLTGRNPYLLRKRLEERRGISIASLGGSVHWSRLL